MCRLQLPLNPDAVAEADEQIYGLHAKDPRPNPLFDADGNRLKLDATDQAQAGLREKWRDLYRGALFQITSSTAPDERGAQPPPPPPGNRPVGDPVQSCPLKHWIEVQLVKLPDQAERPDWWPGPKNDGGPYPYEPFTAGITDGDKAGALSKTGSVRYDPIPQGKCWIQFAWLCDQVRQALEPASSGAVTGTSQDKHWIKVQLVKLPDQAERPDWWPKDDGGPYPGEPFKAGITDGRKESKLDGAGTVRYDPIPGGKCWIQFADFYDLAEEALKPKDQGAVAGTGRAKHWIKVQLVKLPDQAERPDWWPKDDGGPYPDEPFTAEITDGRKESKLDGAGTVRYDPIPGGKCWIQFADFYDLAEEALKPRDQGAVAGTGRAKHWIKVQLVKLPDQAERPEWWPKDDGGPYPDEPFKAGITDGPKDSKLDGAGSVRYDPIPGGKCWIQFADFYDLAEEALKPKD